MIDGITPDLIIVDPDMPSLRGIIICLHLCRISPAPILVLSTAKTRDNEVRGFDAHAEDCLGESFDMAVLALRIDDLLSSNQSGKNN